MKEDFVPFEIAKKLKEKGFREKCFARYSSYAGTLKYNEIDVDKRPPAYKLTIKEFGGCYNLYMYNDIDAPTISQVLKWLREKKRIDAGAVWDNRDGKWVGYINEMDMPDLMGEYVLPDTYDSYELAALAGVEYVVDNLI